MVSKSEAYTIQSAVLVEAAALLTERRAKMEELARRPENQDAESVLFNTFRVRSVSTFVDTIVYIASEIQRDDDAYDVYRLPMARTVMDIFVRYLYIQSKQNTLDDRFLKLLSYQMLGLKFGKDQALFEKTIEMYEDHLNRVMPDFPRQLHLFNFSWIRKNKLTFPPTQKLLREDSVRFSSPLATKIFGTKESDMIYGFFSEVVHGNPYIDYGPHNQRFWLISLAVATTSFFLELVDAETFGSASDDFKKWLNRVRESKDTLSDVWRPKM